MANCQRSRELAQAYLEGALASSERAAFENHLRACPSCRRVVAEYGRLFSVLAEPAIPRPSADLAERVMRRVVAAARRRRAAQTAVSAAAIIACGTLASLLWNLPERLLEALGEADLLATATSAVGAVGALVGALASPIEGLGLDVRLPGWFAVVVVALAAIEVALLTRWRRRTAPVRNEGSRIAR